MLTVNHSSHFIFFSPLNPRYSGNHFSGRGGGGHQRAEQQLLSGYQQEGRTVRSGECPGQGSFWILRRQR